jgi:hypothetical protein
VTRPRSAAVRWAATALLVVALAPRPALAGADPNLCCVCSCTNVGVQCGGAASPDDCEAFFSGCVSINGTCGNAVFNQTCASLPVCNGGPVAPSPSLDLTGLTAAVLLLTGLAGWRLRRLVRQRR